MDIVQKRILLDLAKAYREKVRRAAAHMHEMCEISDIPEEDMLSAIYSTNLFFVVEIIDQKTDMSAEDFAAACAEALQERRANRRRARRADVQ